MVTNDEIRNEWFKDHVAKFEKVNDTISVLDWKQQGTICYYVRYVFDGSHVYITGDLGEAVMNLTWFATPKSFLGIDLHYFHEKLAAYHEEKKSWDSDSAVENLKYWIKEYREEDLEKDEKGKNDELLKELIDVAEGCTSTSEWAYQVNENYADKLSEVDCDYWEWIYGVGDVVPNRFRAYLVGLQMAAEQLEVVQS